MTDAVAYVAWERVVPWKILSMLDRPGKRLVPVGFGARSREFLRLAQPGSQIWVVTRIRGEFSLAGRVAVARVLDRENLPDAQWPRGVQGLLRQWRYVAIADPDTSEFFETNNARAAMEGIGIARFAQNRTIAYREASIARSFDACMAQAGRTVFLSYCWDEGRRFAFALAHGLRQHEYSPWLDALSVPAYEAGREPDVTAPRLKKLIRVGIEQCRFAVVINTAAFARHEWTKMELSHIRKTQTPWFQVMRGGTELSCERPSVLDRNPAVVVETIVSSATGIMGN